MTNRIPKGILAVIIGILDYYIFIGGYQLLQLLADVPNSELVTFILKVSITFASGFLYLITAYSYPKDDLEPLPWLKKTA